MSQCITCDDVATSTTFCKRCGKAYDRWNEGNSLPLADAYAWVAGRARRHERRKQAGIVARAELDGARPTTAAGSHARDEATATEAHATIHAFWYPLDGDIHKSVAYRLSALHLLAPTKTKDRALCDPDGKHLYTDDETSAAYAKANGLTLCSRCKKKAST